MNNLQIFFDMSKIHYLSLKNKFFKVKLLKIQKQPPDVFCKKGVLRNFAKFTGKHLYQRVFFNKKLLKTCNFIKKDSVAQVFSCNCCEISKNTFFLEHLRTTASESLKLNGHWFFLKIEQTHSPATTTDQ